MGCRRERIFRNSFDFQTPCAIIGFDDLPLAEFHVSAHSPSRSRFWNLLPSTDRNSTNPKQAAHRRPIDNEPSWARTKEVTTRFDFPYGVECQIFVTDADGLKRLGKAPQRFEVRHELLERGGKPTFKPSRAMEEEIATRHDRVGQSRRGCVASTDALRKQASILVPAMCRHFCACRSRI